MTRLRTAWVKKEEPQQNKPLNASVTCGFGVIGRVFSWNCISKVPPKKKGLES